MAKKVALGKGMASLIGGSPAVAPTPAKTETNTGKKEAKKAELSEQTGPVMVKISEIQTNPNQPRKIFKEKELEELSLSIKENGIIQPLIVVKAEKGFELVAGERRLRASKMAGLKEVPVVVKRGTDRDKMIMSIIENVQRSDLNCVEEALAYYQLMEDFKLTQEEVAKKLGKERSTVANFLRILKLPRPVIDHVQKEDLSFGHAKILASVKDRDLCIISANEAVEKQMSVRELEKLLKSSKKKPSSKIPGEKNFFNEKIDELKQNLEKNTGFHFAINSKENGAGKFEIKFSNEAEFNDIYEYLLKR